MGDSFLHLFGRARFAAPRPGRRKAAKFFVGPVDHTQLDIGEANEPVAIRGLGDADWFADQDFADEDEVATPFDLTVAAHPPHGMLGIIPRVFDAVRIAPQGSTVVACRRLLAVRLMRPFVVVMLAKAIEANLLLTRRCR